MQTIYTPKGKALEYAELALNLYTGCSNGCIYCYASQILHMSREEFYSNPQPRKGILEALEKDAPKYSGQEVLLSFTSDPYQQIERELLLTRKAIEILKDNNIRVKILTKSALAARDFQLLDSNDSFGMTLTFLVPSDSQKNEPNASYPTSRLVALNQAKECGIKTWASLEPVIKPEQTLALISLSHTYVDEYKVGKLNYAKSNFDLKDFLRKAIELFEKYNKKYYIKKDTRIIENGS